MGLDPHVLARGEGAVVICLAKGLKMSACGSLVHAFVCHNLHNASLLTVLWMCRVTILTQAYSQIVTRHIPLLTFAAGGPADG